MATFERSVVTNSRAIIRKVSSARTITWRKKLQNARHPVNDMLNYGYGMLANQMRSKVIAAGLDPTIGIIQENHKNPIPPVYDLMEPLRPVVDQAMLEFALSRTFTPGDFMINSWGGCQLNPRMAKVVAGQLAALGADRVVAEFLKQVE